MTITIELFAKNYNPSMVKSKEYRFNDETYTIYNYDTSVVCENDYDKVGLYRSVIRDSAGNIVSYAPPKSVTLDYFEKTNFDIECNFNLYANEIIEGTMINLFYNKNNGSWEISTKSAIGGNYWYFRTSYQNSSTHYKQMTFREMFMEALGEKSDTNLNDASVLKTLNRDYIYSFVMQHPMNHIVLNIQRPTLYLVSGYSVENKTTIHSYSVDELVSELKLDMNAYGILTPKKVDITGKSMSQINEMVGSANMVVGVMIFNASNGQRVKLLNDAYSRLKDIRGNNPNLHYHYLSLFAAGKVDEFLSMFPSYKRLFYEFYQQSYEFIKEVHDAYVSYYVLKQGKTKRIPKPIFTHIYTIHSRYYLPNVNSETPTIVTRDVVAKYYNDMTPKEKLYHVTYKTREYAKIQDETNNDDDINENNNMKETGSFITASY
jgi:hypothetical protein